MNEAGVISCPKCGAPASTESPKCLHCGARLAKVSCPSCFGMLFEGAKFCPHCGARGSRTASDETSLPCPKCKTKKLGGILLGETPVAECAGCHGLWVDVATFDSICTDRERQSIVLGSASETFKPGQRAMELNVKYVRCPSCNELMHRVNFAKCSGIIIDVCKGHGTWFDRDELQHIVEFIRTGGLEVAREKEKAELEQARRRLEAARSAATGPRNYPEVHRGGVFTEADLVEIAGSIIGYLITPD